MRPLSCQLFHRRCNELTWHDCCGYVDINCTTIAVSAGGDSYKYELLKRQSLDDTNRIQEAETAARVLREQLKQQTRRADEIRDSRHEVELEVRGRCLSATFSRAS